MKFHLFEKFQRKTAYFDKVEGYSDVKEIIRSALDSDENYNLLLIGPPASSKTLFLQGILDIRKGVYFDASNTTNRIQDILEEERPTILCIDEIDKMSRQTQNQLLNLMENGHIKVDQQKKSYDFTIKGIKVFASANDINRISEPLQSRFMKLYLPRYSVDHFLDVSVKVLAKLSSSIARYIGNIVYKNGGDIRQVISIGKLIQKADGPQEIDNIIETLMKYGKDEERVRNDENHTRF